MASGVSGRVWKLIGLASLAGVAATGVVLARNERRRRAYSPDEIRSRLHERYAQAQAQEQSAAAGPDADADADAGHRRWAWSRVLRGGRPSRT